MGLIWLALFLSATIYYLESRGWNICASANAPQEARVNPENYGANLEFL